MTDKITPPASGQKQGWYRLYLAAFLLLCLLPAAAIPFVPKETADSEPAAPALRTEDGGLNLQYTAELELFFSQNVAGRQQLISLHALLQDKLLHTSASDQVIVGTDGWLYYAPTAADYTGMAVCTNAEIQKICRVLELMAQGAKARGADFVFTVPPNKNTLYPAYMPKRYQKAENASNLELLTQALAQTNVTYCDLLQALEAAQETDGQLLYHRRDTHWNNSGALYGCSALVSALEISLPPAYASLSYSTRQDWTGDLDELLYPVNAPADWQVYYNLTPEYRSVGRFRTLNDPLLRTQCDTGEKSLLMFRDSFGIALIPFLSDCVASAQYERSVPYNLQQLETTPVDCVVLELVERNLKNLLDQAPILTAQACELPWVPQKATLSVTPCCRVEQNLLQLCGCYDGAPAFTADTRLVVQICTPQGETTAYEAFPCLETDLTGGGQDGFSLRLPGSAETYRGGQMTLLVETPDEVFSGPTYTINW